MTVAFANALIQTNFKSGDSKTASLERPGAISNPSTSKRAGTKKGKKAADKTVSVREMVTDVEAAADLIPGSSERGKAFIGLALCLSMIITIVFTLFSGHGHTHTAVRYTNPPEARPVHVCGSWDDNCHSLWGKVVQATWAGFAGKPRPPARCEASKNGYVCVHSYH
ncbi:hypothetical protein HDU96_004342 [Phlyctochytrium bullatum]|nr:hypothetical protein HDU96_004342 [Phlyctochytrium bullatum]